VVNVRHYRSHSTGNGREWPPGIEFEDLSLGENFGAKTPCEEVSSWPPE